MTILAEPTLADALEKVLRSRKSIRAFRPDPLPQALIDRAFEMARWTPANCNTQPWRVHLVSGASTQRLRAEIHADRVAGRMEPDMPYLMELYPPELQQRQIAHITCQQDAFGIAREDKEAREKLAQGNMGFWGAPHVAFLFMPAWGNEREASDLGAFSQSLMLACQALGFGSCPQTSLGMMAGTVKRVLGVGPELKLLFGVAMGWPDEDHRAVRLTQDRLAVDQFVTRHD